MSLYSNIIQRKRSALTILITAIILGMAYPMVADSPEDWVGRLNGFLVGLLGGLTIVLFELHVFFLPKKIYSFSFFLISKILCYTVTFILIIVFVVLITRSMEKGVSLSAYFYSEDFHFFLSDEGPVIASYTFSFIIIVITTRQISRKMGTGEFFNFVVGKYHSPKREHRIFLAIDLQNSTAIAEQLGELRFHEFLKRCFYDMTHSIVQHEGQIYRYVGDQVMISWLLDKGLRNSNSVRCFFNAKKFFEEQENFYQQDFGVTPKFRAVLDMGEVLTAEIGLDKRQLVFYGDVLQRIELLEKVCKAENQFFLLSEYIAVPLRQKRDFEFSLVKTLELDSIGSVQLLTAKPIAANLA